MTGYDTRLLVVSGSVTSELEDFSGEVCTSKRQRGASYKDGGFVRTKKRADDSHSRTAAM